MSLRYSHWTPMAVFAVLDQTAYWGAALATRARGASKMGHPPLLRDTRGTWVRE